MKTETYLHPRSIQRRGLPPKDASQPQYHPSHHKNRHITLNPPPCHSSGSRPPRGAKDQNHDDPLRTSEGQMMGRRQNLKSNHHHPLPECIHHRRTIRSPLPCKVQLSGRPGGKLDSSHAK